MENRWYMMDAADFENVNWEAAEFNSQNVYWNKQKTWFIFPMLNQNPEVTEMCCNYPENLIQSILASDDFGNIII